MIKSAFRNIYTQHLQKKWCMTESGAGLLAFVFYSEYVNRSKGKQSFAQIWHAHKKGFAFSDWTLMGLDDKKCSQYISNAQYCARHPYNGQYTKWIDDKLTLKYLCSGTILDQYMPRYYFMINAHGRVIRLMDCPETVQSDDTNGILELLKEKGSLAIKRISGSIGEGFYKAEYSDEKFYLNGIEKDEEQISSDLAKLRDYLIIEYLSTHEQFAEFCAGTCNCMRYLVGRIDGKLKMMKSYIRFGDVQSGFVENYNAGGVLCFINEDGYFNGGNIMDLEKGTNIRITEHPDTKKKLEGRIPQWDEIKQAVKKIEQVFPQMDYLGIDFVITADHQIKILEINSLTSLDTLQLLGPFTDKKEIAFFLGDK